MAKSKSTSLKSTTNPAADAPPLFGDALAPVPERSLASAPPRQRAVPRHACVIPPGSDVPVCGELVELAAVTVEVGSEEDR